MTVNLKSVHLSSFGIGLQTILSQLGVELQRQAENDKVEQFGHYMWKIRQVLFDIRVGNSNLTKSLSEKSNHAMYQDENPHRCLLSLQNLQNQPFFSYSSDLNTQN